MTALDKQLAAAGDVTGVFLDPRRRRSELIDDLLAVAGDGAHPGTLDPDALATRPSILRRLAALLAEDLPTELDRLGAADASGLALTTALALHTGLPYAVLASDDEAVAGEIHRGERLAILDPMITTGARALGAARLARARGAQITGIHTVLEQAGPARAVVCDAGYPLHALLTPADLAGPTEERR